MRNENSAKVQWVLVLGTAFAWFGQHCGAGFCSGVQIVTYFGTSGYRSIVMTVVPFIVLGITFYLIGEYARRINAQSYKDVAGTLYSDSPVGSRIGIALWDIVVLSNVLISGGTVMAGGATLLEETFGMNYFVASVLFALCIVVICMFGAVGLAKISLPLVSALVVVLCIVAGILVGENQSGLAAVITGRETFDMPMKTSVMNTVLYTGLASNFIGAYMAIAPKFNSSKDTKVMAVTGAVLNAFMLSLMSLALLSEMPEISASKLPILAMIRERFGNFGPLTLIYQVGLFLAYVTTGVGNVFAATSRFGLLVNRSGKKNQKVVDAALGMLFLAAAVAIAQFGLAALVSKGYKFLSTLRFPIYVLGTLIFVPIRFRQMKKKAAQ